MTKELITIKTKVEERLKKAEEDHDSARNARMRDYHEGGVHALQYVFTLFETYS